MEQPHIRGRRIAQRMATVLLLKLLVLRSSSFLEINPISRTGNPFHEGAEQM